jgi:hypothetical protein
MVRLDPPDTSEYSDRVGEQWETSEGSITSPDSPIVSSETDMPPQDYHPQDLAPLRRIAKEIYYPGENEFNANLLEYSRSVIKSAIDHDARDSQDLEENMIITKEKVIAQYRRSRRTITAFETTLSAVNELGQQAEETIATLKADQARLNADLKLEMQITDEVKRMYQAQIAKENRDFESWKKERVRRQALEAEIATLKRDIKRKRENVAEIWEKVEKVKVNK